MHNVDDVAPGASLMSMQMAAPSVIRPVSASPLFESVLLNCGVDGVA